MIERVSCFLWYEFPYLNSEDVRALQKNAEDLSQKINGCSQKLSIRYTGQQRGFAIWIYGEPPMFTENLDLLLTEIDASPSKYQTFNREGMGIVEKILNGHGLSSHQINSTEFLREIVRDSKR